MRARNIKPGLFANEQLAELPHATRLLFIALWCIADKAGRLEDRPRRIHAQAFPYEPGVNVDAMLNELVDSGFVRRYTAGGVKVVAVTNFLRHQSPHHKEAESELPEPDSCLTQRCVNVEPTLSQACPNVEPSIPKACGKHVVSFPLIPDSGLSDSGSLIPDSSMDDAAHRLAPTETAHTVSDRSRTRQKSPSADSIGWTADGGWTGIDDQHHAKWAAAFPACDLDRQLAAMSAWLEANPAKAHKSRWSKFIVSWLTKSQDRGGDTASSRPTTGFPRYGEIEPLEVRQRRMAETMGLTEDEWKTA